MVTVRYAGRIFAINHELSVHTHVDLEGKSTRFTDNFQEQGKFRKTGSALKFNFLYLPLRILSPSVCNLCEHEHRLKPILVTEVVF